MAISALSAEGEYIKKEDILFKKWQFKFKDVDGEHWFVNVKDIESLPTYSFPDREKAITEIETDMSHFCFDDWGNENETWTEIKRILRGKANE